MLHGNCGRQPKHTIDAETKSKIIEIWKQPEYEECNFKHFQEFVGLSNICHTLLINIRFEIPSVTFIFYNA